MIFQPTSVRLNFGVPRIVNERLGNHLEAKGTYVANADKGNSRTLFNAATDQLQ